MRGEPAGSRTSAELWQKGQRKLQPAVKKSRGEVVVVINEGEFLPTGEIHEDSIFSASRERARENRNNHKKDLRIIYNFGILKQYFHFFFIKLIKLINQ
jgi:hypothetical protein